LKIPLANNHADINQITNYKIIVNAQKKLHVCLQAERKEMTTMMVVIIIIIIIIIITIRLCK
jgi:hypothetical protein